MQNTLFNSIYKNPKKVIAIVILLMLILFVFIIFFYINDINQKEGKIAVEIKTNPPTAKVIINNKEYKNGTSYLDEGIYDIQIQHEDFETLKQTLEVKKDSLSKPIILASLNPKTEKGKEWTKNNQKRIKEFEKIQFQISDEYGKKWIEKYPAVQKLPIKDPYFTISYQRTEGDEIYLTIRATSARYREAAIRELYRQGIDPVDYKIEFFGYENPLLNKSE